MTLQGRVPIHGLKVCVSSGSFLILMVQNGAYEVERSAVADEP